MSLPLLPTHPTPLRVTGIYKCSNMLRRSVAFLWLKVVILQIWFVESLSPYSVRVRFSKRFVII